MHEDKRNHVHDVIVKSANVQSQEVTEQELRAINKLTLTPLQKEEVFTFKVAMCDNEIDREFEVFPLKTLQTLSKFFIGKTVIKDHNHTADNQVARIYSTELVQYGEKKKKNGELYTQLVAHCYMLNSESNKDLIAEIKAGIKKEVSVGCACSSVICSICGVDNRKDYCKHYWGREYDGKICYFKLENAKDAYELSFVAVPAQVRAGTIKNYGAEYKDFSTENTDIVNDTDSNDLEITSNENTQDDKSNPANNGTNEKEINNRIRLIESKLFLKEMEENNNE